MSETAPKSLYSTAASLAIFAGSVSLACELDTQWTTGHVVRGHLELDADGDDDSFNAEMAAWDQLSDEALMMCDSDE